MTVRCSTMPPRALLPYAFDLLFQKKKYQRFKPLRFIPSISAVQYILLRILLSALQKGATLAFFDLL